MTTPRGDDVDSTDQPTDSLDGAATSADTNASRRRFLAGLGVGGVILGAPAVAAAQTQRGDGRRDRDGRRGSDRHDGGRLPDLNQGLDPTPVAPTQPVLAPNDGVNRFVRIFDGPVFAEPSDELTEALVEVGRPGGIMDANDPLEVGPIRLIAEPELSPNNRDNPTHTAGSTFIGQFLDHDITSDAGSPLGVPLPESASQNLRSARFDLDSVYGGGPDVSPHLYHDGRDRYGQFRIESGGLFEDLPRAVDGSAIVAEARNDENLIISGLQVAFLSFHNAMLRDLAPRQGNRREAFFLAQRTVRWHYQWLILHQFLPQYVGQAMVDDVLSRGRQFYTSPIAQIPLEFQTAAYRFGHSMIRPSYRANLAGDNGEPFFALVFDLGELGKPDPDDLTGRHRAPRRFIGWQTFFDFADGEVKPNKRVDTSISTPMFNLPTSTISSPSGQPLGPLSLPTRNLLRHTTWQLPSGQYIAQQMGTDPLATADLADIGGILGSLATSTPLWFYILREADIFSGGLHLGPVGGRLVAEVFIGLLQNDPMSFLNAAPGWTPTLPSRTGEFRMADLLTVAGVDPISRGQ